MSLTALWAQGEPLNRAVAALLLLMSVLSWCVIVYKIWLLGRARRGLLHGIAAFWQAPDQAQALHVLERHDRLRLAVPLALALSPVAPGSLSASASEAARLTRRLRDALQAGTRQLQWGQIVLATIGATAPFVGLLGTVWGIYHALAGLAGSGPVSIDKVAGPVGESLIMTAFGLMVAIPAVVAYNLFGRIVGALVERLDGFAHDVLALQTGRPQA